MKNMKVSTRVELIERTSSINAVRRTHIHCIAVKRDLILQGFTRLWQEVVIIIG